MRGRLLAAMRRAPWTLMRRSTWLKARRCAQDSCSWPSYEYVPARFAAIGAPVCEIERADVGISGEEHAAGLVGVAEADVGPRLPHVAEFQRSTEIPRPSDISQRAHLVVVHRAHEA